MHILIPFSFLGFDSVIYLISAVIGFIVAYYAFRVHDMTSHRPHFYLYMGFSILSMGLLILSITSFYGFINLKVMCTEGCYLNLFDNFFDVRDFGYWLYYVASVFAYGFFALMYLPHPKKFPIFSVLPLWFVFFPFFHLFSFFIISYVIFRSLIGYINNKSANSLLIFATFLSVGLFHLLLFLTSFSKVIYVLAHLILLLGFMSLLTVLIRVNKKSAHKIKLR